MAVTEELEKQAVAGVDGATPDYSVDYNDPRFGKVETEKNQTLNELEQTYGGMIESSDKFYDAQIQASKDWEAEQTRFQQEQTDFTIEKIEQQKDQAEQDYKKEQSGAYVDWQKQSSQYGANAERMASAGLTNTGYSESSQVSMYNTYQNRVATARESYQRAVLNYDNSIKDAMLQNNAALAEIAYTALQQQLELSLQGFQYRNTLILDLSDKKMQTKQFFADQWLNVLNQINTENALAEDVRQFESNQAWQTEQKQKDRDFTATENQKDRDFQATQADLNRKQQNENREDEQQHDKDMLAAQQSYKGSSGGYSGSGGSYTFNTNPSGSGGSGSVEKSSGKSTSGTHTSSSGATHGGNSGSFGSSNYTPTHSDAVDYMVKMGVPENKASALETINEWSRHPNGKTYEQYVISYVDSCLAQI